MLNKLFITPCLFSLVTMGVSASSKVPEPTTQQPVTQQQITKPNVVIFYVDDLGWGDLSSYGATQVKTPNVDALAENGIRFTDAHSSAATCTPSRYSLLTGEHAFRKNVRILKGDAAMVISPNQKTLPKMLQKAGYQTGVIGKWHLGLGDGVTPIDWNTQVKPGPLEIGFDYSFLLPATGDRVPSVYLENYNVLNLDKNDPLYVDYTKKIGNRPTGYENQELLRQNADNQHDKTIINGISRIGWMQGGKSAEWVDEEFHTVTTNKAKQFITQAKQDPFFLFFSFHDIHVPRLPNKMFKGATTMGVRGDAIVQMDWITGQVVDHLKALNLLDNTLIIFTSDNGAVLTDGYDDEALTKIGSHKPNGPYSGGKYSIFEGGTRVPFIVHYPTKARAGVNNSLFSQIDIYASIAKLIGTRLEATEAIDSENQLAPLLDANQPARTLLAEETPHARGIRNNEWKYIRPVKKVTGWVKARKNIDPGTSTTPQLFNLNEDPAEKNNIADKYPQKVKQLESQLAQIETKTRRSQDVK